MPLHFVLGRFSIGEDMPSGEDVAVSAVTRIGNRRARMYIFTQVLFRFPGLWRWEAEKITLWFLGLEAVSAYL